MKPDISLTDTPIIAWNPSSGPIPKGGIYQDFEIVGHHDDWSRFKERACPAASISLEDLSNMAWVIHDEKSKALLKTHQMLKLMLCAWTAAARDGVYPFSIHEEFMRIPEYREAVGDLIENAS